MGRKRRNGQGDEGKSTEEGKGRKGEGNGRRGREARMADKHKQRYTNFVSL